MRIKISYLVENGKFMFSIPYGWTKLKDMLDNLRYKPNGINLIGIGIFWTENAKSVAYG